MTDHVVSDEGRARAKGDLRPVRERRFYLTDAMLEDFTDEEIVARLTGGFEYVTEAKVVRTDKVMRFTDPDVRDCAAVLVVRGVVSDDTQPSTQG